MRTDVPVVPLSKAVTFRGGGTPSKRNTIYWGGPIPWVSPKDMKSDLVGSSQDTITSAAIAESSVKIIPEGATLVVVRSGILARTVPVALAACELTVNQDLKALIPGTQIESRYLNYFLRSAESYLLSRVTRGATVHKLDSDVLKTLPTPVPTKEEQKRIVAILDKAFAGIATAVANTEKNLANAHELFESYLNSVFSKWDEGWVETELSRLISISHGFAFKGADFKRSSDVSKPIVLTPGNYTEASELEFAAKNTKRFYGKVPKAFLFALGDLTVVMTDLSSKMKILGKPAFVNRADILHNQRIGRVILKSNDLDKRFLYYFLRTSNVSEEIRKTATGTMVKHTAPKRILSLRIPMPKSRSTQEEITSLLDVLSTEVRRAEGVFQQKLTALAELKQSLLQKAFSGELSAGKAAPNAILKEEEVA